MTIDELLAMAVECVKLAHAAMDTDYTADPASVAQAAAQTAQAMILRSAVSETTWPALRIFGEVSGPRD